MKSHLVIASVLACAGLATSAEAAKKYYFSVGCYPNYAKLHRISCDVGTSWKVCADEFCNRMVKPADEKQRDVAGKPPKLMSPFTL